MLKKVVVLSGLLYQVLSVLQCGPSQLQDCTLRPNIQGDTVVVTDLVQSGTINCVNDNCRRSQLIVASSNFAINCRSKQVCESATIQTGIPIPLPPGFTLGNFDGRSGTSGDINCFGESGCANVQMNIAGNYPAGVQITARGKNSLQNAEIRCALARGQECRIICDMGAIDACAGLTITCDSCNCDCTGPSCPAIVFGSSCPDPKTLGVGVNKRFPEILCEPDFPRADECLDPPFIKFAENGLVDCIETADCCACDSIQCESCAEVKCDGERSCIGLPINIEGNVGGASLACNLRRSCALTDVTATNIVFVNCNGVESCQTSSLVLNPTFSPTLSGLAIQCGGDNSCEQSTIIAANGESLNCGGNSGCRDSIVSIQGVTTGFSLDCSGNNGCQDSEITLSNVFEWYCTGNSGCRNSKLTFDCLSTGCALQCSGSQACRDSVFNINNINRIDCGGSGAGCFSSEMVLGCVSTGCPISCNNQDACRRSNFTITNSNGLLCLGAFSCAASNMTLINNVNGGLTCQGQSACRDINIMSLSNINKFDCISFRACRDTNIVSTCDSILGCTVSCRGPESCFAASIQVTNVIDLQCNDDRACSLININLTPLNSLFSIQCNSPLTCNNALFNTVVSKDSINSINGINCVSTEACFMSTFIFDASSKSTPLLINQIACVGIRACSGIEIILINTVIQESNIICMGIGSCDDMINIQCQTSNGTITNDCILTTPI